MEGTLALVLAGGRGSRLRPLTDPRPKPVVPFAGRRLIDFTLENCRRSGISNVTVLVQHRAEEVRRHLRTEWRAWPGVLADIGPEEAGRPFLGTADAVRAVLPLLPPARHILVLAGDHVYRMDYRLVARDHVAHGADATLAVAPAPRCGAKGLGVVGLAHGFVASFEEKPEHPPDAALVSMGIYLFERGALAHELAARPGAADFGYDVLPSLVSRRARVAAHLFAGYWRDIADVSGYHAALMDIIRGDVDLGPGCPGPGCACLGEGSALRFCVFGRDVRVGRGAALSECVLLDGAQVGDRARLHRVIVEEGARIPADAVLGGREGVEVAAEEGRPLPV